MESLSQEVELNCTLLTLFIHIIFHRTIPLTLYGFHVSEVVSRLVKMTSIIEAKVNVLLRSDACWDLELIDLLLRNLLEGNLW